MAYEVRSPVYTGPVVGLVELVGADRLDLFALALADLVREFLAESDGALDLEEATELAVAVATLVVWKCRRLLPTAAPAGEDEAEDGGGDLDALLVALVDTVIFAGAGRELARLAAEAAGSRPHRGGHLVVRPQPNLLAAWGAAALPSAYARGVERPAPEPVARDHVAPPVIPLEEVVVALRARLAAVGRAELASLVAGEGRAVMVAWFLASLELYRQGAVDFEQPSPTAPLVLRAARAPSDGGCPDD